MILPIVFPAILATVITGNASAVSEVSTTANGNTATVETTVTTIVNGETKTVKSNEAGTIRVETTAQGTAGKTTTNPPTITPLPEEILSATVQAQQQESETKKSTLLTVITQQLSNAVSHFFKIFSVLGRKPS